MKSAPDPGALPPAVALGAGGYDLGLAAAINQAGQGVVVTDPSGRVVYVNAAFTSMTGYSWREAIGRTPSLLKSGSQDPAYYKDLWETISHGRNWQGELINRRKDGSLYIEEMTIAPVLDSTGRIVRYIALKKDVTEQRKSAEAQRLLAAIVASTGDAIIGTTLDGIISTWNGGAEAIYGYRADEAVGQTISMLLPPERCAEKGQILDGITSGGKLSEFETVRIAKDGHLVDVLVSMSPIKDAAGKIVGAASITRDIRERRRAYQALSDHADRFRALFERSLDCLYIHDFEGNFLDANPATLNLFGYTYEELLSLNSSALLTADQIPKVLRARRELDQTGTLQATVEYRLRCKTGAFVDVETKSSVIPFKGTARAILAVARDITGRNRAEEALRASEEKFRQLAESIREVFWMMNAAGTEILYVSPAYEQIWGRTCDDLYRNPMSWLEAIEPEDRERAHAVFLRQMEGEQVESEYRIRTPGGELKWVRDRAFPIRNPAGEIIRVAGIAEDVSARKQAEAALAHQARHDHLTGLPNRLLLSDRLEASIERAKKSGLQTAVIYVDLDGFKFVNDTLGHEAGDMLLQQVTERLQRCIRELDTLARMGGDEFMLVINEVENDGTALSIAERLRAALKKPFSVAGQQVHVTASAGIAMYPRDGQDVSTLRSNADTAMYGAKRAGKDRVQLFSPALRDIFLERWELEAQLRQALERGGQFFLDYQPIFEAQSQEQTAFEALLRWRHPELGLLSPSKFVPIAEESGLIFQLGAWVLRQACEQCRLWQQRGPSGVRVAVNVSALEFAQPEFAVNVLRVLEETGLPGRLLDLELTETTLMRDLEPAMRKMSLLRSRGVRIAIDDFGTGYSSLGYLARLPVDALKIDRSFVSDLAANPTSRSLVAGMIALAHSIGKRVVVEGVETEAQLEILRGSGCDEMQGFLLGRPRALPFWKETAAESIAADMGERTLTEDLTAANN